MQHETEHAPLVGDREGGFSLVEVVVAMVLLSIVSLAFLPLVARATQAAASGSQLASASRLVSQQMELVRAAPPTTCPAAGPEPLGTSTGEILDGPRGVRLQTWTKFVGPCSAPRDRPVRGVGDPRRVAHHGRLERVDRRLRGRSVSRDPVGPGAPDERGLTMAELLVSCALLVVVLALAGVLLQGGVTAQRDVQAVTQASDTVQVAARSIERGVRSASAVSPISSPTAGSQLLVVRLRVGAAGADATWVCQGWYHTGGVLYTRRVDAAGAPTPALTTADLSQWSVLASAVVPRATGVPILSRTVTGTATTVGLDLAVSSSGTSQLAVVSTVFSTRPQGQTGGAPCF